MATLAQRTQAVAEKVDSLESILTRFMARTDESMVRTDKAIVRLLESLMFLGNSALMHRCMGANLHLSSGSFVQVREVSPKFQSGNLVKSLLK